MLKLKAVLKDLRVPQIDVARYCGISAGAFAQIVNHDLWPKKPTQKDVKAKVLEFLAPHGVAKRTIFKVEPECANTPAPDHPSNSNQSQEDEPMLLRKQILTPVAKKHFGLVRDPFGDLQCKDDLWISPDIRYVREHMYNTARHGGFLAVIGESGSGKSSVRRDLEQRIADEHLPVTLVQPFVLATEDNDKHGKTLKITHVSEAIMAAVAPHEPLKLSSEARFQQLSRVLKDQHRSGRRVCVLIEEAHSLPIPTIKHLKRLLEIELGYTKLVSIILLGQTKEMLIKLSEKSPEVREVVQRCEVVTLQPIEVARIEEFINHRMQRMEKKSADIIDATGIAALCKKMVSNVGESQLYPLAVGNFLVAALNDAAKIGVPVIDEDIINEVV